MYNIGAFLASGTGIRKDVAEAAMWLRKAAEQGHPWAEDVLKQLEAEYPGV